MAKIIPVEHIERSIFQLRGKKVMLDRDLARLYEVETRALNQAVSRNQDRFPEDFMVKLSVKEAELSRSQNVILKRGKNIKHVPYAFTEQGVAMLSSVLKSKRAVQVNIQIMRAFTRLREMLATHIEIRHAVENLERRVDKHDRQIQMAIDAIRRLLEPPKEKPPARKMGFTN